MFVNHHSLIFYFQLLGSSKETQLDILKKFKTGYHKCLVATAVASEGIDIPQCNLIIRYRFTASEITSVQMKGKLCQMKS